MGEGQLGPELQGEVCRQFKEWYRGELKALEEGGESDSFRMIRAAETTWKSLLLQGKPWTVGTGVDGSGTSLLKGLSIGKPVD